MVIKKYVKHKFQTLFDKDNPKQTLLNTAYMLFLLSLLCRFTMQLFETYGYESFSIPEFLINYQGGFVRRGLMGEILFFFTKHFNINVEWTIKIVCLICFVAVCVFFVRAFLRKGYTLYMLPLCFFLGGHIFNGPHWIRKDHLMLCFFIVILWVYNKINTSTIKFLTINILVVFILLIHEVFALFALPILFFLLFNQYKNKGVLQSFSLSTLFLLPGIVCFFLTLIYHGNLETAQTIWDSWVVVANQQTAEIDMLSHGALSAIGWPSKWAFLGHLRRNFLDTDLGVLPLLGWSITFPVIYYIATNALVVFQKHEKVFTNKDKTTLSSILIFQFLCLLPVFTILSCDYGRIIFYWIASSFAIFLLIPIDKIEKKIPAFFVKFVERLNNCLANMLRPTKTTVALPMMFIGISTIGFNFYGIIRSSMIHNILLILSQILIELKVILITLSKLIFSIF